MKTTPATYSAEALAGTELPPAPPPSKKKASLLQNRLLAGTWPAY